MAASRVRQCYLLCRIAGINVTPRQIKPDTVLAGDTNNTLQTSVRFASRNSDDTQDTQVHIPVGKYKSIFTKTEQVKRLTVSYSRSSGPGGQHVNKVSTKAEVRFHVKTADWIQEDVRRKIFEKNQNRINKAGELLVTSELSRSQHRNLSDCVQKISAIIAEASKKPHEPTAEDVAVRAARLEKRNKERLKQKKIHSTMKQSRRVDFD
ncbi:peptidyl-tRNA hydrolase ICT1, mitochondrial isoform X1 [Hippoglossus hippoglossus]|uniref:peptidyl-tRNA hydrolase ICT1, mitochondrial isoform X1 n=1 Tax=Hippoglossus hippoglossus TaxID=8267 RepID=UPI00148C1306|nr:peptidyl-tRNA hydrolase ICT1, mitochondrial isoform X1 [Hippoglossus hippoglossus]